MAAKLTANVDLQADLRQLMERQAASGVVGALKAMADRPDSTTLIGGIRIPLVLLHGDADLLIPVERAREAKATTGGARLTELAGIGHMPMLEAPAASAGALKTLGKA
jgi:pimeloyl-ACP methyl ester carboxylesterase